MRPLSYRTKLVLSHFGLVGIVIALVSVLLERSLASDLERQRDEHLVDQARGATEWVSAGRHPNRVASRLAPIVQANVTIFDADGCVIGSSDAGDEDTVPETQCSPPPEVSQARQTGVGRASRPLGDDRFDYVAVPTDQGLVLRFGVSARDTQAPIAAMRERLIIAALIAAFIALVLGQVAAQIAARPLRSMARQADRIARGDYNVRLPALAKDEFGQLAESLAALAKQLQSDMDRIGKLEITRRDFVANVTHELRTPVAAIQGCAETLQRDIDPAQAKRFIDMMHKHAQRISGLVDGLLRLAELDVQEPKDQPLEPVDLLAAARDIAQTLAARAQQADMTLSVGVPADCIVRGDPTAIEQVFENLVDNAIKYGKSGGKVVISADRAGDKVRAKVSDDGPGIGAEHIHRIFERFYRVDAGRSRERGGAGLGLAIVKHLVESMGGTIAVESEPGVGTTFLVELPASDRPAPRSVTSV